MNIGKRKNFIRKWIYGFIYRKVLKHSFRYLYNLQKLRKNQWLSPSELEELQQKKLRTLLYHAYYKVDYYRRLFNRAGIRPEDIKDIRDLVKIPVTSRKELQSLSKLEIIAWDTDPLCLRNLRTSGSTGIPLDIFVSPEEINSRWLSYRRMYFENGGKWSDREVSITTAENLTRKEWHCYLGILKMRYLSIFENIDSQLKFISEFKPDVIQGYLSAVKNLAIEIKKKNMRNIHPRIIFTTAELMTKQDREFFNSVFKAELIHYYACNECGIIAWECKEHSGYHINSDRMIVEILKEDGTLSNHGEEGEVVVTSLDSHVMPFIRYKVGDIGMLSNEKCPCGRKFPMIKNITGRSNDCISLPNGNIVSSYKLTTAIENFPEVYNYQIIQDKKDRIKVNIVKNERLSPGAIIKIRENFRNILGENIEVLINEVDEIIRKDSGKFKVLESQIR